MSLCTHISKDIDDELMGRLNERTFPHSVLDIQSVVRLH
jgi:hypothetical protein